MENVGCVAYNDLFLKPEAEMTDSLRFRIAYITLHELAHMWFGDLVTNLTSSPNINHISFYEVVE